MDPSARQLCGHDKRKAASHKKTAKTVPHRRVGRALLVPLVHPELPQDLRESVVVVPLVPLRGDLRIRGSGFQGLGVRD